MIHSLFEKISSFNDKINNDNLDIDNIVNELKTITYMIHQNVKLRITMQLMSVLYVVAIVYQNDSQNISIVKNLIKKSLRIFLDIINQKILSPDVASYLSDLTGDSRCLLAKKLPNDPFLYHPILFENFAIYLEKDIETIQQILDTISYDPNKEKNYYILKYYLDCCYNNILFLGIEELKLLLVALQNFVDKAYENNQLDKINAHPDILLVLDYFFQAIIFIKKYSSDKNELIQYFENNKPKKLINRLSPNKNINPNENRDLSLFLTQEEVNALMNEHNECDLVSFNDFDNIENQQDFIIEDRYNEQVYKYNQDYFHVNEDHLIKLIIRLFQKQEYIKSLLPNEIITSEINHFNEIETLTQDIREILFNSYYITIHKLLGQELRDYIQKETAELGKELSLTIRGEESRILTRESEFIKNIVFQIVQNAIHTSLQSTIRRKALNKNEKNFFLIEFDDTGDHFDIYIEDDGQGISPDHDLSHIENEIQEKGGVMDIESVGSEYLKVHIQLPMKKIMTECLVISLGGTCVLLPNHCVDQILSPKEVSLAMKHNQYSGQINLTTVLGMNKSPINMFIACKFSQEKIFFGVDTILYTIEALVEKVDAPIINCVVGSALLNDGTKCFIIDEKILYKESKEMINKRILLSM